MSVVLPQEFLTRMEALLGAEYPAFLAEYEKTPTRALYKAAEVPFDFAAEEISHLPGGYTFDLEKPGNHPLHHAGAFYVQDPSAMATVSAVPFREGMRCLDLCASPGGKTVQIAHRMGKEGFLVSNEINPSRCKVLYSNVERMGFPNVQVTNADPKRMASWYPDFFDLVTVDAPCSGEGMFRKYENAPSEWSANAPAFCAERQREILHYAAQTVAPGGYLLYATCTFSVEENEGTVEWFLEEFPGFALLELPERLQKVSSPGVNMPFARRFYPHKAAGEGQFVALLQRDGEGVRRDTPAFTDGREHIPFEELRVLEEFLEGTLEKCGDLNLCKYGKYLFSATMPAAKENTFSPGVTLGTVEKRRFVPHHQLFKCFGSRFLRKLALTSDDKRVMQYLSGAEIDCELEDGWAVVTLHGLPLGGIKVSCGRGKNHYPKGLRVNGL